MTPFLTAQVPYGTKGFTFLLGHLTYAHRKLTEEAMGTVQGSGAGADAKRIWFRGWVAQQDTGREGWATLVIENVAVNELAPEKLERLQWKLSQLNHSLADALASAGAQTAQAGNYLEAPRLREWEVDLEVAQLPSAGAGPVDPDLFKEHSQTPKRALYRISVIVIGLVLLSVFLWKTGSNPPNEPKPATAEDSQGSGPAKDTDNTMKIPQQNTSNGWTPGKRKPWKDLVNNWKAEDAKPSDKSNVNRAARAVDRIAAELKKRSETTMAKDDQILLNDYLAESFCPQTVESQTESRGKTDVSEPDSLQPELKAIHDHFKMLKDVNVVKLSTVEQPLGQSAFNQAVSDGLQRLISSQFVQNTKTLCSVQMGNALETVDIAPEPAPSNKNNETDINIKKGWAEEKWKIPNEISQIADLIAQMKTTRYSSGGRDNLMTAMTAIEEIRKSLLRFSSIRIEVTAQEVTEDILKQKKKTYNLKEQSLLQLLHRNYQLVIDSKRKDIYLLELSKSSVRSVLVDGKIRKTCTVFQHLPTNKNAHELGLGLELSTDPMSSGSKEWQELRKRLRESIDVAEKALGPVNLPN
ncbi:MAG: hypothetical protein WCK86_20170 [Planctomycetia bacterium]